MKNAKFATDLTNAQWEYLEPMLPEPAKRGRPPTDHRRMIDATGRDIRLQIDGGVTPKTSRALIDAGADTLVAGSAVYGAPDYAAAIAAIRSPA